MQVGNVFVMCFNIYRLDATVVSFNTADDTASVVPQQERFFL